MLQRTTFYAEQHLAENTRYSYAVWVARYRQFCIRFGFRAFPVDEMVLASFLCDIADDEYVFSTINVAFSSLKHECDTLRLPTTAFSSILISRVLAGIRRAIGDGPTHPAAVLSVEHVRRMAVASDLHPSPRNMRSIAMITVGFFGLLRRSEIVQIRRSHIGFRPDGMVLRVPKSKTDQTRIGHELFISAMPGHVLCPVFRFRVYLASLPRSVEVVFGHLRNPSTPLSPASVGFALQQLLDLAGIDRSGFSAHSLRRGGACAMASAGIPDDAIRAFGRWHPDSQVYRRYIQGSSRPGYTQSMIQALSRAFSQCFPFCISPSSSPVASPSPSL